MFQLLADGVRKELQVCGNDLANKQVSKESKEGFNVAMNALTSALGYCLVAAELANHPLLGINKPNRWIISGIVRSLQHVKERSIHSFASFMLMHMDMSTEPADGMDYWSILSNKEEPCTVEDIIRRIEQAVEESIAERSKEAAVDALKGLLASLEDDE